MLGSKIVPEFILNLSIMKKIFIIASVALLAACTGNGSSDNSTTPASTDQSASTTPSADNSSSEKGIGKFSNVKLDPTLNQEMATKGQGVFDVKCSACHKLTDEKLVGPGWKGVTSRHKPEWIMNFVTNVDEMLNKDPKAQAQLEICLVRMPNQNLTDDDARSVLEFMRKNDGVK